MLITFYSSCPSLARKTLPVTPEPKEDAHKGRPYIALFKVLTLALKAAVFFWNTTKKEGGSSGHRVDDNRGGAKNTHPGILKIIGFHGKEGQVWIGLAV